MDANRELVDRGDLDELARHAARLSAAADWDGLVDLRARCRAALERGRQLWPVASRCEYLLALHAPVAWAGPVVREGAGRFAPGPLAEVVAADHAWADLAPHLPEGPLRAVVAHERALRGEDLTAIAELAQPPELPLALQPWEPAYALADYTDDGVTVDAPPLPPLPVATPLQAPRGGPDGATTEDPVATAALREVVAPWVVDSNGRVAVAVVEGRAEQAIAALGPPRTATAELTPAQALAYLAWTGASGGAHGRRRGAAAGRTNAWWAAAALCGLDEDWPVDPAELGRAVAELRWLRWTDGTPATGWRFHLAVEDPADGLAWAVAATDAAL